MLRWPGNVVHFLFLIIVLLVCGLVYGIARLGIALFVWGKRRGPALGTLRGWMLKQAMSTLGATFIKLGQVMSTRPDLFAPEVIEQLRSLQDRIPPFGFSKVQRTISEDFKAPLGDLFKEFDEKPVAAASVAQVHRARLRDGKEVAVKVLRPGVRRQVERDQVILIWFARVIALHPGWRRNDPVGHTRHFIEAIHDQTDLCIEEKNYELFHKNFAGLPNVRFPEVHKELCSARVLTMEFIRGTKVDALPPGIYHKLAEVVRTTFFKMCFQDGFVHADLHPGNMVVQDNDCIVIYDVGLAKLLHEDVLIQFIDMTKCIAMGTPDDIVAHLRRFHTYIGEIDWEALRVEVTAFAAKFRTKDAAKLEYGELIGEMFAIGRKHKVRPVTDMMLVFVALITAQGIGKMLEPEHNVFGAVAMYLIPILMKRNEKVPDTDEARVARGGMPAAL
ncbi:MAG TPA: AarF/UbiB family protein [Kofleriaceae bacterium]